MVQKEINPSQKVAFFRCEASPATGAGHAMRCSVLADALLEKGWSCAFITSQETYDFISTMSRFERIDPDKFYANPAECDLLIVDNYDLDASYEKHFRPHAKKIIVIDDLADRPHDCDILVDQTYGRKAEDYRSLVPATCEILAGSEYALLRPEFAKMRPKALEKRRNTTEIKKILVTMGGSDPKNFTLKALKLIKDSEFKGDIDVVLGFSAPHREQVKAFAKTMLNRVIFHMNADMVQLIYEADLAIGAGGTSVWERCCLGLPSILMVTADNQKKIYENLLTSNNILSVENFINNPHKFSAGLSLSKFIDGFGCNKLLLTALYHQNFQEISLKPVMLADKRMLWEWQKIKEVRQYFNNPTAPTREEHEAWFMSRFAQHTNPYWIIYENMEAVGCISFTYNHDKEIYDLSWFIIPSHQGRGLGSKSLQIATFIMSPFSVRAIVKEENMASHASLKKAGFIKTDGEGYIFNRTPV